MFVMPFSDAGDLGTFKEKVYKEKIGFTEEMVLFFAVQIISAIGKLHDNLIIHRDIKLDNILIDRDGYLKVCDFGLAEKIEKGEKIDGYCGTPTYMAPEILK